MNKFKLRAECSHDVSELIKILHGNMESFTMKRFERFSDVEFHFETNLDLKSIKRLLNTIADSHVMAQTIKDAPHYDGIRAY